MQALAFYRLSWCHGILRCYLISFERVWLDAIERQGIEAAVSLEYLVFTISLGSSLLYPTCLFKQLVSVVSYVLPTGNVITGFLEIDNILD